AAVVSSGTATVETALLDTPMVVVYRVAKPTALLVRPLLRAPFICMVNLIAGRSIVPELIQDNFRPERVAQETLALLESPEKRRAMRQGLAEVRERLGPPGAVDRAAEAIVPLLEKRASNTF
ncbi:MAG TPA: lipid-A-disaccharide synthase, partial [Methylomirabilota bacterium]|nr:lipid-A-disaccharide synthase [Methylomirabilota bacterium]